MFLYTQVYLVDYELSEEGNLNLIYIKYAFKKRINEAVFNEIKGHTLILKYENIINLNLTFIQSKENSDGDITLRMIE